MDKLKGTFSMHDDRWEGALRLFVFSAARTDSGDHIQDYDYEIWEPRSMLFGVFSNLF